MFTAVGQAVLGAMPVMLCSEPSLAELDNLGALGNCPALFFWVLENGKRRGKCCLSWTKMTQKLCSQVAPTLFCVFGGCFFVLITALFI